MKKRFNISLWILFIILGICIGFFAGAGLFLFRMDAYFSKLNFFASKKDTVVIEKKITIEVPNQEKKNKLNIKYPVNRKDTDRVNFTDSFVQQQKEDISLKHLMTQGDSLTIDSKIKNDLISEEEIIVRKDEMVAMKTIPVLNIGDDKGKSKTDSVLQMVSGIRDDGKNVITSFKVEFWQSPVNYKGYKMGKNKIALFGVKEEDDVTLYKLDDDIFLKHNQNFYRLDYANEFRAFDRLNDPIVLTKLK